VKRKIRLFGKDIWADVKWFGVVTSHAPPLHIGDLFLPIKY
jgi:hypothetical protein